MLGCLLLDGIENLERKFVSCSPIGDDALHVLRDGLDRDHMLDHFDGIDDGLRIVFANSLVQCDDVSFVPVGHFTHPVFDDLL
jgi:hypothetical protein